MMVAEDPRVTIVADRYIPNITQTFPKFARVLLYDGHDIDAEKIHDADALLVRSVSHVDEHLLRDSRVKLVASATSGLDHIDVDYLQRRQIGFVDAGGANARAVAEYVISSLFFLADQADFSLQNKSVAVVGCGRIGKMVLSMFEAIGMVTMMYDPPLQELAKDDHVADQYCDLEALYQADIISLHVPLTTHRLFPTRGLVGADFLARLNDNVILLNTSRGGVVDEEALKRHLLARPDMKVVLDVWAGEPSIDASLLAAITIGTPHIAGYSAEAKHLAGQIVFKSVYDFFGFDEPLPTQSLPELDKPTLLITDMVEDQEALKKAVLTSYDVRTDSLPMVDSQQCRYEFNRLRQGYALRREFSAMTVQCPQGREKLVARLRQLGFRVCQL